MHPLFVLYLKTGSRMPFIWISKYASDKAKCLLSIKGTNKKRKKPPNDISSIIKSQKCKSSSVWCRAMCQHIILLLIKKDLCMYCMQRCTHYCYDLNNKMHCFPEFPLAQQPKLKHVAYSFSFLLNRGVNAK